MMEMPSSIDLSRSPHFRLPGLSIIMGNLGITQTKLNSKNFFYAFIGHTFSTSYKIVW